jgi:hypothetical protein
LRFPETHVKWSRNTLDIWEVSMGKLKWILCGLIITLAVASAHTETLEAPKGAYFGQEPPGKTPEVFAPGFISSEAYEVAGTFSPTGDEYFFSRRPDASGSDNRIYYTKLSDGQWTTPCMPTFAAGFTEHEPHIDPAGELLFFHSSRPKPAGIEGRGTIWFSRRESEGWSEATYLGGAMAQGRAMYISSTRNGDLYFTGAYDRKYGVFFSRRTADGYAPPEYLPSAINHIHPAHPYISPDELVLIFDAYTAGPAQPEIYVSFRQADGSWTEAVKLGPEINATQTEYAPSLSPDRRYLFFHREIDGNGDIWWVDAEILKAYKP